MKKLLALSLVALVFVMPLSVVRADTLTTNDVKTVAPQLSQALGSLSMFFDGELLRQSFESVMIADESSVLQGVFTQINAMQYSPPTQSNIDLIATKIQPLASIAESIQTRRNTVSIELDGMIKTLGGIISVLSTVKA